MAEIKEPEQKAEEELVDEAMEGAAGGFPFGIGHTPLPEPPSSNTPSL